MHDERSFADVFNRLTEARSSLQSIARNLQNVCGKPDDTAADSSGAAIDDQNRVSPTDGTSTTET